MQMEFPEGPKPSDIEKAFLASWQKKLKEKLPDEAIVSGSADNRILEITLKDKGPYIRIVFGEEGSTEQQPFGVHRRLASKTDLYSEQQRAIPLLHSSSSGSAMPHTFGSTEPEIGYKSMAGVEELLAGIISNIQKHRESYFS
jgi:hypothetical protein